ncbi:hypothetical protein A9X61_01935 [Enterobacter asburiae]|nr:hypothetical protein A9X61_01935 [Enterobacter asburiae]
MKIVGKLILSNLRVFHLDDIRNFSFLHQIGKIQMVMHIHMQQNTKIMLTYNLWIVIKIWKIKLLSFTPKK